MLLSDQLTACCCDSAEDDDALFGLRVGAALFTFEHPALEDVQPLAAD